MTIPESTAISSRRAMIAKSGVSAFKAVALVLGGGWAGAWFANRMSAEHDLSSSIIHSDNGVDAVYQQADVLLNPFADLTPRLISPEVPATEFSYTALIRNSGDFSEHRLQVAVFFEPLAGTPAQTNTPETDASTRLLVDSIVFESNVINPFEVKFGLEKLNPQEWVSIKTTWSGEVRVEVEARSNDISSSEDY